LRVSGGKLTKLIGIPSGGPFGNTYNGAAIEKARRNAAPLVREPLYLSQQGGHEAACIGEPRQARDPQSPSTRRVRSNEPRRKSSDLVRAVKYAEKAHNVIPKAIGSTLFYVFATRDLPLAERFFQCLAEESERRRLADDDPMLLVSSRTWINPPNTKKGKVERCDIVVQCWNLWRRGKTTTR
jgi:hypothetical protein